MKRLLKVTLLLWSRGPVYAEGVGFCNRPSRSDYYIDSD